MIRIPLPQSRLARLVLAFISVLVLLFGAWWRMNGHLGGPATGLVVAVVAVAVFIFTVGAILFRR